MSIMSYDIIFKNFKEVPWQKNYFPQISRLHFSTVRMIIGRFTLLYFCCINFDLEPLFTVDYNL